MNEANVKVGTVGTVKVGRNAVRVRVLAAEGMGWKVQTESGKEMVVKTVTPVEAPAPAPKRKAAAAPAPERKLSLVKAAVAVLEAADEAMNTKSIVAAAKERGLWTPGAGKTPEQTLYSAMVREIKEKGGQSRFRLVGRGQFALNR